MNLPSSMMQLLQMLTARGQAPCHQGGIRIQFSLARYSWAGYLGMSQSLLLYKHLATLVLSV